MNSGMIQVPIEETLTCLKTILRVNYRSRDMRYLLRPQCQGFRAAPCSVKIAGIFFFLLMATELALRS